MQRPQGGRRVSRAIVLWCNFGQGHRPSPLSYDWTDWPAPERYGWYGKCKLIALSKRAREIRFKGVESTSGLHGSCRIILLAWVTEITRPFPSQQLFFLTTTVCREVHSVSQVGVERYMAKCSSSSTSRSSSRRLDYLTQQLRSAVCLFLSSTLLFPGFVCLSVCLSARGLFVLYTLL